MALNNMAGIGPWLPKECQDSIAPDRAEGVIQDVPKLESVIMKEKVAWIDIPIGLYRELRRAGRASCMSQLRIRIPRGYEA